ncbi:hypothetical protein BK133_00710 [Paenibacillus sp. FSL H8-0548]|nr:hypothetical protein BK133_00710 [Paenibacillus sp. FSL H8-0548]
MTQLVAAGLFLAIAFIVDIRKQIIPNWLTAASFAAAIVYHAVLGGMEGITAALIGAAAGFFPLLLLHLAKGIGAGDVKLFAALGAWLGVWTVLQVLLYSILYAGAIGICLVIMNRTFGKRLVEGATAIFVPAVGWRKQQWLQWARSGKKFPFMLAVAPAAITVWSIIS